MATQRAFHSSRWVGRWLEEAIVEKIAREQKESQEVKK